MKSLLTSRMVASSPGFSIPSKITFKSYRNSTSDQIILQSSSHPRLDYEAHEEQDENVHLDDYLGMFDAETGTLKLVKAKRVVMRNTLRPKEAAESEAENVQETVWSPTYCENLTWLISETVLPASSTAGDGFWNKKNSKGYPRTVVECNFSIEIEEWQASSSRRSIQSGTRLHSGLYSRHAE